MSVCVMLVVLVQRVYEHLRQVMCVFVVFEDSFAGHNFE